MRASLKLGVPRTLPRDPQGLLREEDGVINWKSGWAKHGVLSSLPLFELYTFDQLYVLVLCKVFYGKIVYRIKKHFGKDWTRWSLMPNLVLRDHNLTGEKAEGNGMGLVSRGQGDGGRGAQSSWEGRDRWGMGWGQRRKVHTGQMLKSVSDFKNSRWCIIGYHLCVELKKMIQMNLFTK